MTLTIPIARIAVHPPRPLHGFGKAWDEGKHPRNHGRFSSVPGASGPAAAPATARPKVKPPRPASAGAKAPTAEPSLVGADDKTLGHAVLEATGRAPRSHGFGGDVVFMHRIYEQLKPRLGDMSLEQFKRKMVELNRNSHVALSRADLVHPSLIPSRDKSEVEDMGATFHFIARKTPLGFDKPGPPEPGAAEPPKAADKPKVKPPKPRAAKAKPAVAPSDEPKPKASAGPTKEPKAKPAPAPEKTQAVKDAEAAVEHAHAATGKAGDLNSPDRHRLAADAHTVASDRLRAAGNTMAATEHEQLASHHQRRHESENEGPSLFGSHDQAHSDSLKAYGHAQDKFIASTTPAERSAVMQYTAGFGFKGINDSLRAGKEMPPDLADSVGHLDNMMKRTKTPDAMTVYRGSTGKEGLDFYSQFKEGDTFEDKGFVSTSANPKYVTDRSNNVKIVMSLPKGTRAIPAFGSGDTEHEKEMLLDRGTKFRVVSREQREVGTAERPRQQLVLTVEAQQSRRAAAAAATPKTRAAKPAAETTATPKPRAPRAKKPAADGATPKPRASRAKKPASPSTGKAPKPRTTRAKKPAEPKASKPAAAKKPATRKPRATTAGKVPKPRAARAKTPSKPKATATKNPPAPRKRKAAAAS